MDDKQQLMKEGVDPVSGNEKPVGSLPEEVRDDVNAKLSVGEFVLPADVVRYIGLNNIMKLRDAAKAGLQRMDAQGQMGNGDEQVVEDHPIDMDKMIDDVATKDETEMAFADGGMVPSFAAGGVMQSRQYTPVMQYQAPQIPTVAPAVAGVQQVQPVQPVQAASVQYSRPTVGQGSAMQSSQYTPVYVPPTVENPLPTVAPAPTGAPTPGTLPETYTPPTDFTTPQGEGEITEVVYVGPNGEEVTIRFRGTVPLDPIPVGYVRKDSIQPTIEEPEIEQPEIEPPEVEAIKRASQQSSGDSGDGQSVDSGPRTINQRKTDTKVALAQLLAKDDPELQAKLDEYADRINALDFTDKNPLEMLGEIFSRVGLFGIIKTVGQYTSLNSSKKEIAEAVAEYNTGVAGDLLRQWSESTLKPEDIMSKAKVAQFAGASQNLALAIAIDDRFDIDSLQGMGEQQLSSWEQTVADVYGVNKGSAQAITLAKEDLDFFTGEDGKFDKQAALDFYGDSNPLSPAMMEQIAERDDLEEQMQQMGLGNIGSMSAAEAEKKIADEEARLEEVARKAEEDRKAEEARNAEIARKAEEARKKQADEAAAAKTAAQQDAIARPSGSSGGSWNTSSSGTSVYTPTQWSASNTSSWDTSGGGSNSDGSYDISSWFNTGGLVGRKKPKEKKTKRKTSL